MKQDKKRDDAIKASLLPTVWGRRTLEHIRRKWFRYYTPEALKRRKKQRLMVKKSRRQNRKKR